MSLYCFSVTAVHDAHMMSTACFENPLFDRTFLIMSKRPSSVCVSLGAVLSYEGDSGGYLDEVTRLAELLTTVAEVVTNSEQAIPMQLIELRLVVATLG